MPSISQAKLDEMAEAAASLTRQAHDADQRARRAEDRLREFDAILDKVVRAAHGVPLTDSRDGMVDRGYYMGEGRVVEAGQRPKRSERQEQEIRNLNDQVAHLQSRIAAVVAVAQFARAHKA